VTVVAQSSSMRFQQLHDFPGPSGNKEQEERNAVSFLMLYSNMGYNEYQAASKRRCSLTGMSGFIG